MRMFRKKPVVIEAVQITQPLDEATMSWLWERSKDRSILVEGSTLSIETLEGTMRADVGDWIICGVKGEIYPCKPDIFAETYEEVEQ